MTLRLRQPRKIRPTRGAYLRLLAWMVTICALVVLILCFGYLIWAFAIGF